MSDELTVGFDAGEVSPYHQVRRAEAPPESPFVGPYRE